MSESQIKPSADRAQKARWICDLLRQDFPACFKMPGSKQPIKSRIHQDLLEHYKNDTRFTEDELRLALAFYTRGTDYLKTLLTGANRIDLTGKAAGLVQEGEEQYAQRLLLAKDEARLHKGSIKAYVKPVDLKDSITDDKFTAANQPLEKPNSSKKAQKKVAYID